MFLIILGLVLLAVSRGLPERLTNGKPVPRTLVRIVAMGLMLLGFFTSLIVQVDVGQVGVPVLFGKVTGQVLSSGLSMVNPLSQVEIFDIKTQNYTMSAIHDEGGEEGDGAIRTLSADGLEVTLDITVLFRPIAEETPRILREIGKDYLNVIVRPVTRTKIRDNAVYYNAVDLYSTKRDEFQQRVFAGIEKDFKTRGLFLEQLFIRNISLPESVKQAIEAKINAEQEAQKMQFVLDKERQEAERKRVEAQGIADYQKIINSQLTDKLIQYETVKAYKDLSASPNSKMIIMGNSKTPILLNGN
ncbi:MAG: prohibitin family protein [Chitinophagales bacterium]|nr:prohibitin family protein [Chitinophagales bacterium]